MKGRMQNACEQSSGLKNRQLCRIVTDRTYPALCLDAFMDDMSQQVSRSLQFFLASGTGRDQPDQVLVCGGCANIPGVADVIGSRIGIATDIGDPLGQMKLSSRAKSHGVQKDATALLTACGLALRSFD
jgi:type IV pilus assembly protein PilM